MPFVSGKENDVRLFTKGGQSGGSSGVVLIFKNGRWGTICDKSFVSEGWPTVVCREMGYKKAVAKRATKGVEKRSQLAIGLMGPSCSSKDTKTMADCGSDNIKCGHEDDVFVTCKGK